MSCKVCEKITLKDSFKDVMEYAETIRLLADMEIAGEIKPTYMTCPFDRVFADPEKKMIAFYARRMFHQVQCTQCGAIYGLVCDVERGAAQLKENPKIFNPDDYVIKE